MINGGVPEVERAVAVADAAFREWSVLAPKDRGRFLPVIRRLQGVGHRP
jgi:acyl-CoA reductase-like NAD-dependent aldehyde dehydrogenase